MSAADLGEPRGKRRAEAYRGLEEMPATAESTFAPKVARWLVGVASVSLLVMLLVGIWNGERDVDTVDPSAFSRSAVGHEALAEFLGEVGIPVTVSRDRSAQKAAPDRPLLLLEPGDETKNLQKMRRQLRLAAEKGVPVVVALPKWKASRSAEHRAWAAKLELLPTDRVEGALAAIGDGGAGDGGGEGDDGWSSWRERVRDSVKRVATGAGRWFFDGRSEGQRARAAEDEDAEFEPGAAWDVALESPQFVSADATLIPLVYQVSAEGEMAVLVGRVPGRDVYVVADPDLLSTMGLGQKDNALVIYRVLSDALAAKGVVIDEVVHGFERVDNIFAELFRFPVVLLTFHLAGLLALGIWAALFRFGKPEPRPPRVPTGKAALLDNTATLLAYGHHAGHGVREYFRSTLRAVARMYGLPSELSDEARFATLADLAARRGAERDLTELAADVAQLQDRRGDERRALALARRIYSFRTEMLHGHRSDS